MDEPRPVVAGGTFLAVTIRRSYFARGRFADRGDRREGGEPGFFGGKHELISVVEF
jgi:hypothetical protein